MAEPLAPTPRDDVLAAGVGGATRSEHLAAKGMEPQDVEHDRDRAGRS